jgi:hypothetical protein
MAMPYHKLKQMKNGKLLVKTISQLGVIMQIKQRMERNTENYTTGMR